MCSGRFPVAKMDVVGQGYRCSSCSARVEIAGLVSGRGDAAANLSAADRGRLRASGTNYLLGGIALAVLGGVMFVVTVRVGLVTFVAGLSLAGVGIARRNAAR
jgi:hypothetical protein